MGREAGGREKRGEKGFAFVGKGIIRDKRPKPVPVRELQIIRKERKKERGVSKNKNRLLGYREWLYGSKTVVVGYKESVCAY